MGSSPRAWTTGAPSYRPYAPRAADYRPRPADRDASAATVALVIPATVTAALRRVARRGDATTFMTVLAGLQVLLSRVTGQLDIAVGAPADGRARRECEQLVGFFINTLVLWADLSGEPTFTEMLRRARRTTLDAYAPRRCPSSGWSNCSIQFATPPARRCSTCGSTTSTHRTTRGGWPCRARSPCST